MTLGVISIIYVAVVMLFTDTFRFNRSISDSLDITGNARRALKVMITEIRITSPSSLGAYPLAQAATSSLIFYGNTDADTQKERIRYYRNGTSLMRGVVDPSGSPLTYNLGSEVVTTIARNVVNDKWTPLFTYYNDSYSGTQAPLSGAFNISDVRLIKITLVVDSTGTSTASSDIFTSQVSLRNLKDNL